MKKRPFIFLLILSISLTIFYFKSFGNFLFQDDFYNLVLAQNHNIIDAFNIFKKPIMGFYFYRPFSTQLYWTFGRAIFGLSPFGYHLINFSFFILSILLVYKLAKEVANNEKVALLTSFFYAFSGSHFYRIYFLSQFQELSLAVFAFSTLILFLKKSAWTPLIFILALTTKETAVMIVPFMLFDIIFMKNKDKVKQIKLFLICSLILTLYLVARVYFFGLASGQAYEYNFSPHMIVNNLFWYGLWSLGLPEAFVNVELFKFPTIINPKLFTAFESWGNITIASFVVFALLALKPMIYLFRKFDRKILFALACFICFILPVAFFPFHKFPYSVTVPLMGISFLFAYSTSKLGPKYLLLICAAYVIFGMSVYTFNRSNHWASKKGTASGRVFDYFKKNYPQKPAADNIYFRNTTAPLCLWTENGSPYYSREISYAISDEKGLGLLYNDQKLRVYFEDFDLNKHLMPNSLVIDSQIFFK